MPFVYFLFEKSLEESCFSDAQETKHKTEMAIKKKSRLNFSYTKIRVLNLVLLRNITKIYLNYVEKFS